MSRRNRGASQSRCVFISVRRGSYSQNLYFNTPPPQKKEEKKRKEKRKRNKIPRCELQQDAGGGHSAPPVYLAKGPGARFAARRQEKVPLRVSAPDSGGSLRSTAGPRSEGRPLRRALGGRAADVVIN